MTTTTSVPTDTNSKQDPNINNNNNSNTTPNNNNTITTNGTTATTGNTTNIMDPATLATNCGAAAAVPAASSTPIATTTVSPLSTSATQRAVTITPIFNSLSNLYNSQNFSRTMQTDEDFNIRFVNLVRNHKCLYDKKVPEYRNRDNQEKAWLQISIETKESVIHCKERWRNLRACLSRYIKQQSGSDPQHKPYYLTEHMAFLLPFLKSTRNSLDGNNSLATLFQYSQQQQLNQQTHTNPASLQVMIQPNFKLSQEHQHLQVKHSLSDNDDEETIDAFDPAITASLHVQQQQQQNRSSPALSDTASANTMQNFIPDVQLSELRTSDGVQDISYQNSSMRRDSHDFGHEPKRIKTECHASEATTTGQLHMYAGEQADMEFFRSILPDIAGLTPQQKRKLKIGILELIDDVVERFPLERSTNANATSQNLNTPKTRRTSSRDWRK
ncbi:RING finger protein B isoform X1 [Lucilia cuprina]|uniref:RING finger protein B isoform X1 n=1 Tax=Lucilia cuprina TaxID=7375 RepID=UPI001F05D3B7|nr:RING finger protein B isoform X1 [Lucilia cuprina]XP_023297007.2 RING finger protein B isoform X1 [Lucilia cuprina]XP_046812331.1 RING finger protein B isoform X1 [Lucilia cuprina]XP_046812332.1 RING finger protein B isoform X1 [Lucilia cuprina]